MNLQRGTERQPLSLETKIIVLICHLICPREITGESSTSPGLFPQLSGLTMRRALCAVTGAVVLHQTPSPGGYTHFQLL